MTNLRQLPVKYLKERLRLDQETGDVFWRIRRPNTINASTEKMRERICKNWNVRFAEEEAFTHQGKRGYFDGVVDNVRYYKHRVVFALYYGRWPTDQLDHINGNRLDNRIENLREVNDAENRKNQRIQTRNTTGHIGVWRDLSRGKFQAYITVDGVRKSLGRYDNKSDAIEVRKRAEEKYGFHQNHGRQ